MIDSTYLNELLPRKESTRRRWVVSSLRIDHKSAAGQYVRRCRKWRWSTDRRQLRILNSRDWQRRTASPFWNSFPPHRISTVRTTDSKNIHPSAMKDPSIQRIDARMFSWSATFGCRYQAAAVWWIRAKVDATWTSECSVRASLTCRVQYSRGVILRPDLLLRLHHLQSVNRHRANIIKFTILFDDVTTHLHWHEQADCCPWNPTLTIATWPKLSVVSPKNSNHCRQADHLKRCCRHLTWCVETSVVLAFLCSSSWWQRRRNFSVTFVRQVSR